MENGNNPRELSSTGKDNALYMQGPGFKSRPPQKKKRKTVTCTHKKENGNEGKR
jgi:hypothetical protein